MPKTSMSDVVKRTVARNQIGRGPYVLITMDPKPMLLMEQMDQHQLCVAMEVLMSELGINPETIASIGKYPRQPQEQKDG